MQRKAPCRFCMPCGFRLQSSPSNHLYLLSAFEKQSSKPKRFQVNICQHGDGLPTACLNRFLLQVFSGSCPSCFFQKTLTFANMLFVRLIREKRSKASALVVITLLPIKRLCMSTFYPAICRL